MVVSVQWAKRALMKSMLALALQYQLALRVTRESSDQGVLTAYRRRLVKRVHPDKGCCQRQVS